MDDFLELPEIKPQGSQKLFPHKPLKIEDLLNFIEFNLKHTIDLQAVRKAKRKLSVSLPFRLS